MATEVKAGVAPPVINAPETVSVSQGIPIPGCSVTDPYAATAGGTMALNLSCDHGDVQISDPLKSGKKVRVDAPLAGINAALATLSYLPPAMLVDDTVSINVWNQAGQESTKRIAVSANGGVTVPPQPVVPPETITPPDPGPGPSPGTGIQASRIADFLCNYSGCDMFPSMDEGNVWGSWPADYRPDTVIAAYDWLMNGSTNYPINRVYTASYRMEILRPWLPLLAAQGHRFVGGVAANGNVADAEATLELARDPANGLVMVEGLNEPNTNFGSGEVPPQMTKDIQDCLWRNKLPGI